METELLRGIEFLLNGIGNLVSLYAGQLFNATLATVVFILGYGLLRVGLQRMPTPSHGSSKGSIVGEYLRFILPGVGFAVLGTIFLLRGDPALLRVTLLTLAVGAGLGALALGCTLIVKSLVQVSDQADAWDDKRLLLMRSAPGFFLAAAGLVTTIVGFSTLPNRFGDYTLERRETRQEVVNVINSRLDEAVKLLEDYVETRPEADDEGPAQGPSSD